jgi:hypothetical protein
MDGHSKVALQCQFCQTFTMVKTWAEMVILLIVVTAMSGYILVESSFSGECLCDVKFGQKHVIREKLLDVSVDKFLVLKIHRCLKPSIYCICFVSLSTSPL